MGDQQERLEWEISWLSAIVESEGWISLVRNSAFQKGKRRYKYEPIFGICNTDIKLINECKRILDKYGIEYNFVKRKGSTIAKTVTPSLARYEIILRCIPRVEKALNLIYPYLIGIKKFRAKKILDFMEIRRNKTRKNSPYGDEEHKLYKEIFSTVTRYRSKILNDFTPDTLI